jgi:hypothetical protein
MANKITIRDAIVMIGHADPDTKIAGWLAIGEKVTEARERFEIISGNAKNGKAQGYRNWLKKEGIADAMSESSAARAAQLFDRRKDLASRRREAKIPKTWTNPAELLKALRWIDQGLDPKTEDSKRRSKAPHNLDTTKNGDVKEWSDGKSASFFWDGAGFRNMMTRLPRFTKKEQLDAVRAFFGLETSGILKVERNDDGSIHVYERHNPKAPVARARFDMTITFHEGAE